MAVVQISRIQHRRGKSDDLPQLASAELGWSINNRKLYIGNGSTVEGAPTVGNTEILTEILKFGLKTRKFHKNLKKIFENTHKAQSQGNVLFFRNHAIFRDKITQLISMT